ncbi:MAG TPA: hypothetical protein VNM69_03405 [Bacillus sp. (in: firmicutes)]|uniref:hypothetical protein n=1 Tax=Bacillus litorisediminis TaxID=2922713 RepID=UPI001FADF276|nr:hypothetical protein [Bacillus litorisediminis]HWO74949.1 hypothetical protein [Bacillus sp. (in: firmicutes)]
MFDFSQVKSEPVNGMVLAIGSLFFGAFLVIIFVNFIYKLTNWEVFQSKDFLSLLGIGYLALWGYIMFFMGGLGIFL